MTQRECATLALRRLSSLEGNVLKTDETAMSVSFPQMIAVTESSSSTTAANTLGDLETLGAEARQVITFKKLLVAQACRLLMRLDEDLMEARAQFNQDWFRRVMRVRSKAASRLRRRWGKIYPPPTIPLGNLRRRYHANLARYLYQSRGIREIRC